ncbi:MAG: hypothetical protein ACKVK6_06350, partial [bacterium]
MLGSQEVCFGANALLLFFFTQGHVDGRVQVALNLSEAFPTYENPFFFPIHVHRLLDGFPA